MGGKKEDGTRTTRKGRFEKGCADNGNRFFVDVHILVFPLFFALFTFVPFFPFSLFSPWLHGSFFHFFPLPLPCSLCSIFPLFTFSPLVARFFSTFFPCHLFPFSLVSVFTNFVLTFSTFHLSHKFSFIFSFCLKLPPWFHLPLFSLTPFVTVHFFSAFSIFYFPPFLSTLFSVHPVPYLTFTLFVLSFFLLQHSLLAFSFLFFTVLFFFLKCFIQLSLWFAL